MGVMKMSDSMLVLLAVVLAVFVAARQFIEDMKG